ncbi:hypothetical protein [uncultured Desulfuromusa sp.]|uniref:hypothetical protein n=1 Tax=uncultured Desulfuromusa sp. TaxID=219183 RepID=UPI002AA61482|nr:hypothetical protein [uncultured Desulfuromusa sp.]
MDAWKIIAVLILLAGLALSTVGIRQVNRAKTPNTCIVNFAKSLGGKSSFNLRESLQKDRHAGIIGITLGVVFVCAGLIILFHPKK